LNEHNNGQCKTTKADSGWVLVHSEEYGSRGEAMKREKWLKTGVGREFLKKELAFKINMNLRFGQKGVGKK
jgi:putative endonuclease